MISSVRALAGSAITSFCSFLDISPQERIQLKELHKHNLFRIGLLLKVLICFAFISEIQQRWFVPFLTASLTDSLWDPWTSYLSTGDHLAFPYGHAMYFAYLPLTATGYKLTGNIGAIIGFRLSTLVFDYLLLLAVAIITTRYSTRRLLYAYWLSPITGYILYIHGQIDILPILLLILGLILMHKARPYLAGIVLGMSISAKLSMLVAIPFAIVYLQRNQRFCSIRQKLYRSLAIFSACGLGLILTSIGARSMILESPESFHLLDAKVAYGDGLYIYIIPCLYVICLYLVWRLETISFDLFVLSVGLGFFSLLILLPPSPGWTLWVIPFLVFYQLKAGKGALLTSIPFTVFFTAYYFFESHRMVLSDDNICRSSLVLSVFQPINCFQLFGSVLFTFMQISAALLCIRMYVYGIARNPFYLRRKKPFTMVLAADSENVVNHLDTLLKLILGTYCVSTIHTSVYLRRSNLLLGNASEGLMEPIHYDITAFVEDIKDFFRAKSYELNSALTIRRTSGKYSKEASKRRDFLNICDSSLIARHTLERYTSLTILLRNGNLLSSLAEESTINAVDGDSHEESINNMKGLFSREDFSVTENSYNVSFEMIGVNLQAMDGSSSFMPDKKKLALFVVMANGLFHSELTKLLIAICGARIDTEYLVEQSKVKLRIEADLHKDDIRQLASILIPDLHDIIPHNATWSCGYDGLIQLVILLHIVKVTNSQVYA